MAETGNGDCGVPIPGPADPDRNCVGGWRPLRASIAPVPQIQPLYCRRTDPAAKGSVCVAFAGALEHASGRNRAGLRLFGPEPLVVSLQALHGTEPVEIP